MSLIMRLLNCIIYIAALGILCFPVGRIFSRISFQTDHFPFRQTDFEKNGKFYEKLKIRKWQNKIPDISKLFPQIVPRKQIQNTRLDSRQIELMINETCVAELVHVLLSVSGIALMFIWPGTGGIMLFLIYILLGNLPFILVQRYNRPRLIRLHDVVMKIEKRSVSP